MRVRERSRSRQNFSRRHTLRQHEVVRGLRNAPAVAPLAFPELLARLSRGTLSHQVAWELLLVNAERCALEICFDRQTGLVASWTLRTQGKTRGDKPATSDKRTWLVDCPLPLGASA